MASIILFYCFASKENTPLLARKSGVFLPGRGSGVLRSYVLGDKKGLSRSLKWAHQALALQHLFTPSGLHLSSIFLLIRPLLKIISPRISWVLSLFLFILPFSLPGFWSIKRISLIKILKHFFPKISWFNAFLISFFIDFFLGTFKYSPLSFCFSFLFLGLIFSLEGKGKDPLPFVLFTGQIVIAFFWQSLVNPFAIMFGQFLSLVFSFLFPIFFIGFWLPLDIFLIPLNAFSNSVIFLAKLTKNFPVFYVTFDTLLLFLLLCSSLRLKVKLYTFIFFICIYPPNLFNLHPKYYRVKRRNDFYLAEEGRGISKIKTTGRGYKLEYISGHTCWYYFFNTYWQKSCY